jgi:hypothetical protein
MTFKKKSVLSMFISERYKCRFNTLGIFGGILSFALSKDANHYALLVIPWVCLILGCTYLVNDEKISALGRYIPLNLVEKVREQTGNADIESIFGWEIVHRSDQRRKRRKIEQLIIDEITFVCSGVVGLLAFWFLVPQPHWAIQILCFAELALLIFLGVEIVIYADLDKGR